MTSTVVLRPSLRRPATIYTLSVMILAWMFIVIVPLVTDSLDRASQVFWWGICVIAFGLIPVLFLRRIKIVVMQDLVLAGDVGLRVRKV
ncbi:hypothetical protein AB0K15_43735 [Amycolatopsis sp. NPDC049253]|uniref:hypothetical protein n=1 Tax=Amycolatopsis sp. NPDC049253 TaxID=3155274 RepID=UPI00343CDF06